jgi:hypothetical protein
MTSLDKLLDLMASDGGEWREVHFYTKASTNEIFDKALSHLSTLADVKIFKDDEPELIINPSNAKEK